MLSMDEAKALVAAKVAEQKATGHPVVPEQAAKRAREARDTGELSLAAAWFIAAMHCSAGLSRSLMYERLAGECQREALQAGE